jgi:hypothetical protein
VRLAGYVLLELCTGLALGAGAAGGVVFGVRAAHDLASTAYASEAEAPPKRAVPPPLEQPFAPRALSAPTSSFLGIKDEILTGPLLNHDVVKVKYNRGGSSISLRLDFTGGYRAAFKPEQLAEQTVPRREIAAYRVSRLLGLESVSPAVGRRFDLKELIAKMDEGSHDMIGKVQEGAVVDEQGMVMGELSWWIPVIVDAKLEGVAIDSPDGMRAWREYLTAGAAEPYAARGLLPQISNMVVFDYFINNPDRWSGSNAKGSPDGKTLYFMDNTLSFGATPEGTPKVRTSLEKVQKFSRALVRRARGLAEADLHAAMTVDTAPYDRLLSDAEIAAVMFRRDRFIEYVDGLTAELGEAEVLPYP